jgi:hypothetical protein
MAREWHDRSVAGEGTVGELLRANVAELDDPDHDDLVSGILLVWRHPAAGRDQSRFALEAL